MKDRGLVIKTSSDFAEVEVQCLVESCQKCSARSLCSGLNQSKGLLKVKNPLKASPGDRVEVEIPEKDYNKALIFIFSTFLLAVLLGISVGHFSSLVLSVSSQEAGLVGIILAILLAAGGLFRYFRKKNKDLLYPVIIDIIKKGDYDG